MILFTKYDIYTIDECDGNRDGRTPKEKVKIEQKKNPFGYPPIPSSRIWRLTVFRYPCGPKSQTFPDVGGN